MDDRRYEEMETAVTIYTDGGCHNTGKRKGDGSYAFLITNSRGQYVDVICEYVEDTTNNRMEMLAVIEGIKYVMDKMPGLQELNIVSDSGYLVKGYTDPAYLEKWAINGWRTSNNKPVQNRDLWLRLSRLSWHITLNFTHIRGHNKDKRQHHAFWNDICDKACTYMINQVRQPGFIVTLRYYFHSKEFELKRIELVDRREIDGENITI